MNNLQTFTHQQFGQVRTLYEDGKPLFCAKDVCKTLGYSNHRDAMRVHCKGVVKRDTPTSGGIQQLAFIPESDLYRLITHSKLPTAERFERWVFEEVLPTIRQTGTYSTQLAPDQLVTLAQTIATTMAAELIKQLLPLLQAVTQQPTPTVYGSALSVIGSAASSEVTDFIRRDAASGTSHNLCKIESFPAELRSKINAMLAQMSDTQTLNFSRVARFCAANGYSVSYPSVKRYYSKYFSE